MPALLIALLAAIVGAVVSAIIAQWLRRARILVVIDEIGASTKFASSDDTVLPNLTLLDELNDSPFIERASTASSAKSVRSKFESERAYVDFLEEARDELDDAIAQLPQIRATAEELSECLTRHDFDGFEQLYGRQQPLLWGLCLQGVVWGELEYRSEVDDPAERIWLEVIDALVSSRTAAAFLEALAGSADAVNEAPQADADGTAADLLTTDARGPSVEGRELMAECVEDVRVGSETGVVLRPPGLDRELMIDSDGDPFIPRRGPRNLIFPWTGVGLLQQKPVRAFGLRTAHAFLTRNLTDLRVLVQFLLEIEDRHRTHLALVRTSLEDELRQFERIVIHGQIANRGGSSLSVTNSGVLFVRMRGYSYAREGSGEPRSLIEYPRDEGVELIVGVRSEDEARFVSSPISVEAGGAARFIGTSRVPIRRLDYGDVLTDALRGGDRTCYAGLAGVLPGERRLPRLRRKHGASKYRQLDYYYSNDQLFRDYRAPVRIPPQGAQGSPGEGP